MRGALRFFSLTQGLWVCLRWVLARTMGAERLACLLDRTGLRSLKARFWRFEATLPDGSRLIYRPHDQCVIDEICARQIYSGSRDIMPGETVVDVGAHIGVFALLAARRVGPSGLVLVVEPAPENLELLRENLARNSLAQVALYPCALADREGRGRLFVARSASDNPVADTLFETAGREGIEVPLRTLDGIAAQAGLRRIDHLKIDAEGAELLILKGGEKALRMTRRVVMEIHPGRVDPEEVLGRLKAQGLVPRTLSKEPMVVEALRAP